MGIGTSLFLLAVGAILRYAITVSVSGLNLHVVGDILMIVGVLGIILSFIFWGSWGGLGGGHGASRRTVVREDRGVVRDRDLY